MSDQKQFLVAGATLECPYGSRISKLLPGGKSDALSIGKKLFLSVNAAEKGKNIAGFEKCQSEYCKGQPCECMANMRLAKRWMNPVSGTKMLTVQNGEEAIHRKAKLLCLFGRTYIKALTTGQDELLPSEKKFYRYMRENFGFDDEVIGLMLKVIYAIDEKYPDKTEQEKAWMFARLMGGFSYGDGSEDKMIQKRDREAVSDPENAQKQKKDIRKWINTAGESPFMEGVSELAGENYENRERDYFTNILGLSEEEYKTLRFYVRTQHEITSRPEGSHPMKMKEGEHFYYDVWRDEFFMEDGFGRKDENERNENNKKMKNFKRNGSGYLNLLLELKG